MFDYNLENIQAYVDYCTPIRKQVKSRLRLLLLNIIIVIPTALCGIYSKVTTITLMPLLILQLIWAMKFSTAIVNEEDQIRYTLYLGYSRMLMSLCIFIGTYKFLALSISVHYTFFILGFLAYIVTYLANVLIMRYRIMTGYYLKKTKKKTNKHLSTQYRLMYIVIGGIAARITCNTIYSLVPHAQTIIGILALLPLSILCMIWANYCLLQYYLMSRFGIVPNKSVSTPKNCVPKEIDSESGLDETDSVSHRKTWRW